VIEPIRVNDARARRLAAFLDTAAKSYQIVARGRKQEALHPGQFNINLAVTVPL